MNQQAIPALTLLGLLMTVSACAGQEPPNPVEAGELPSEPTDVVVTVDHRPGGFGGPDDLMAEFVLRGDGRVIVGSDDAGEPFGETYRLTDAGVGEVRDLFARVARDQTAYGSVTVTDAGSTSLLLNFDGTPVTLDIYALGEPGDVIVDNGLSDDEVAARQHLLDVLGELDDLPADDELIAEPLAPYIPDALDLVLTPWLPGGGSVQPLPVTLATPLLDHPLGYQRSIPCVTVRGADATALAELIEAPGAQPAPWSTGAGADSEQPNAVNVNARAVLHEGDGCAERIDALPPVPTEVYVEPLGAVELADPATWESPLPADRYTPANALQLYAFLPLFIDEVMATTFDDHFGTSGYEFRAVVAEATGRRYLDLEATEIFGDPHRPAHLRFRTDMTTATVVGS